MDLFKLHSNPSELDHSEQADLVPELILQKWRRGKGGQDISKLEKYKHILARDPKTAYHYAVYSNRIFPEGEAAMITSPEYASNYATDIMRKRWPEAEPIIKTDAESAASYCTTLGFRWPEAEPVIATNSYWGFIYAETFFSGERWPALEQTILQSGDSDIAYKYARFMIRGAWPDAEKMIKDNDDELWRSYRRNVKSWEKYRKVDESLNLFSLHNDPKNLKYYNKSTELPEFVWKRLEKEWDYYENPDSMEARGINNPTQAKYAYEQALDMLKEVWAKDPQTALNYALQKQHEFPEGEAALASSADHALSYAYHITHRRFPKGEPAMAARADIALMYAKHILHGKFPEGEAAIAQHADIAYDYANQIQKPFPAGEPAIATDPHAAYNYATKILHGPFLACEETLANYGSEDGGAYAYVYVNKILKQKIWDTMDCVKYLLMRVRRRRQGK